MSCRCGLISIAGDVPDCDGWFVVCTVGLTACSLGGFFISVSTVNVVHLSQRPFFPVPLTRKRYLPALVTSISTLVLVCIRWVLIPDVRAAKCPLVSRSTATCTFCPGIWEILALTCRFLPVNINFCPFRGVFIVGGAGLIRLDGCNLIDVVDWMLPACPVMCFCLVFPGGSGCGLIIFDAAGFICS